MKKNKKETMESYWYCYVYLKGHGPVVRHESYEKAKEEAIRIINRQGGSVEILRCVSVVTVEPKIIEAVDKEVK